MIKLNREFGNGFTVSDTNAIKGLAIVMMFYHHLFAFPERLAEGVEYTALFEIMGVSSAYALGAVSKICVTVFVFLGGYGTYISCKNAENLTGTALNRCRKMYLSFWKVFLVFIPICMLCGVSRVAKDVKVFLLNFIGLDTVYNREWWFFLPYLILICLFPLMKKLIDKTKTVYPGLVAVCFSAFVSGYVFPLICHQGWSQSFQQSLFFNPVSKTLLLLPSFLSGCLFAKYDVLSAIKKKTGGSYAFSALGAFVAASALLVRGLIGADYDWILVMLFVPGAAVMLNNRVGAYIHSVLECIGKESMNMWLIHSFYCYYLCQRIVYAPRFTPLIALWLLAMTFVSSKFVNLLWNGVGRVTDKIKKLI